MICVRANGVSVSFNSSQPVPVLRDGRQIIFKVPDQKPSTPPALAYT